MDRPIQVKRDRLVRIYLVNVLEYDLINSFHLHGNLFHYWPTGTGKEPAELTDTVMQCQGQRGILELRFPDTGRYMFHAHQSEFTEAGLAGVLRGGRLVVAPPSRSRPLGGCEPSPGGVFGGRSGAAAPAPCVLAILGSGSPIDARTLGRDH